jgi:hypothetical protein
VPVGDVATPIGIPAAGDEVGICVLGVSLSSGGDEPRSPASPTIASWSLSEGRIDQRVVR